MKKLRSIALGVGALALAAQALAYEAGDMIVRGGVVTVQPNDDSGALVLEGSALGGTGVDVQDDTQAMLTFTYMVNSNFGIEVLGSTPFKHEIDTTGLGGAGLSDVRLGSVEHLPPTVSLVWYPMDSSSAFQPFIGAGINYWLVLDEEISSIAAGALNASNLNIDDSVGFALRAGFDYKINENWSFNAGVWYIDISTDASVDTALGNITVDVDVDPTVIGVGIGYKF